MARKKEVKEEVKRNDCKHQNLKQMGQKVVCNDCGEII
jgi:hypothetical protein